MRIKKWRLKDKPQVERIACPRRIGSKRRMKRRRQQPTRCGGGPTEL